MIAARSLTMVFAESQDAAVRLTPGALREIAVLQAGVTQRDGGRWGHVLELAMAIIGEAGFGEEGAFGGLVRRSWFVNLENMFERAVRNQFATVLDGHATVASATKAPSVFVDQKTRYPANTDIVIRAGDVICIGDAKYKDRHPRQWPDASEIQELLTHATAYGASKAFLIYPADEAWDMRVGVDKNGCEVWCFGIRLTSIAEDVAAAAFILGYASAKDKAA